MIAFKKYSNIGEREKNEDNCGIASFGESICFAVADGLGGHGGGEIASSIAINTVCEEFLMNGYSDTFFETVFLKAQKRILEEQMIQHAPSRMKTTLVIFVIHNQMAYYAHVGDSRLYILKNGKVKKRTLDHSVPQQLALQGEIKEKEIRKHPDRNKLMRVLGIKGERPRYEEGKPFKLTGKQEFLLCTDGFWELIEEDEIQNQYKLTNSAEEWIQNMSKIISDNGHGTDMDNYTCIAIDSKQKGFLGLL